MSIVLPACTNCGAALSDDDLDPARRTVKCRYCGATTRLPAEPAPGAPSRLESSSAPIAGRPKTPRPETIAAFQDGDGIRLSYRWFSPELFFLLFFCIAWDAFLVFWYSMGLGAAGMFGPVALLFLLFPICHVAVGIGLTYYVIAGFLNHTWIEAGRHWLTVRHGPIPWKGSKSLAVDEVDQLWCSFDEGKRGAGTYAVSVLMKDGRKERLVAMLKTQDEARFIERTLEDFLGLAHHPVAGELA